MTFTLGNNVDDSIRLAIAGTATCPDCARRVHFWTLRHETKPQEGENVAAIYMYPELKGYFHARELSADVPEALKRAFVSTVEAFNSRNFVATSVCCRRTLEGVFKYLVPESERRASLARLIESATAQVDLAAPLRTLSHAIRDGGNLGAHFDSEKEPTEELARQMVELLDYLISYLYVLPKQIQELEQRLGKEA